MPLRTCAARSDRLFKRSYPMNVANTCLSQDSFSHPEHNPRGNTYGHLQMSA